MSPNHSDKKVLSGTLTQTFNSPRPVDDYIQICTRSMMAKGAGSVFKLEATSKCRLPQDPLALIQVQ